MRRSAALASASLLVFLFVLGLGEPHPAPRVPLDRGSNAIWVGHAWWTGRSVRTGAPVTENDWRALLNRLRRHHIRTVFVHAGPIRPDGSIADRPDAAFLLRLRQAPDLDILPWLGGGTDLLPLRSPAFRLAFTRTVAELQRQGLTGIHLDIEPLRDGDPGYLALLLDLRRTFGSRLLVSQATRRAGPFGVSIGPLRRWFWSKDFYRRTMRLTDQTVLMAYDTTLHSPALYRAFVRHETRLLLAWADAIAGHRVLIGIPSFEDAPSVSDPRVETLPNALLGLSAALARSPTTRSYHGVAVYAEWVTSEGEWRELRRGLGIRETPGTAGDRPVSRTRKPAAVR